MRTAALLLAALAALPLLAGCSSRAPDPAAPGPEGTGPGDLEEGRFYAFRHGGGELAFAMARGGSAAVVLYGADDRRLGRIELGGDGASGRFELDGVAPGELVVEVLSANGTLDLRSGGARVAGFEELPRHVERHVLLQRERSALPALGAVAGSGAEADLAVRLLRAPSALRLVALADYQDLRVTITGAAGTVLEAEAIGPTPMLPAFFSQVYASTHEENVRDGNLTASVRAASFEGVLLLEAESFSRARPRAPGAAATGAVAAFTYGQLPDQPVSFHVHPAARRLLLWQEAPAAQDEAEEAAAAACEGRGEAGAEAREACEGPHALVALFGPDDARAATVRVPANGTVAVPVAQAGEWVAVLLRGQATLGADRVPADFELHPLEVATAYAPAAAASGRDGEYAQGTEEARPEGVPFALEAGEDGGAGFLLYGAGLQVHCGPSTLAVRQGGETVAAWGFETDGAPFGAGSSALLGEGPLTVVHDDFGDGCGRLVLAVHGYVR